MARRFIALELEPAALHVAVATAGAQGPQLLEVRTIDYATREELVAQLRKLQQELEPGLVDVAELQLPATAGFARVLEYPFKSRRKLAGVAAPDFFYRLPVESEGLVHDILPLPGGELNRVAVAAVASEKLQEVSELFAEAGFPLARTSILPWGLAESEASSGERQLIAWVRDDEIGTAFCAEGAIRRYVVEAASEDEDDSRAERLLRQAGSLERLEGWDGLALTLYGGGTEIREIIAGAGRELRFASEGAVETADETNPARVMRVALAGAKGRRQRTHNLLKGEFAPAGGWQELRSRLGLSLGLALGVLLLGVITLWSGFHRQQTEALQLEERARQMLRSTFPELGTIRDARMQMEGALRSLRLQAGARGPSRGAPLKLLRGMSQQLPDGLDLVLNEWSLASGEVRLEGSTASFEQVNRLAELFGELDGVSQAAVAESKTASDGRVAFRMRLVLGEQP